LANDSVGSVARDLDLTETALREWVMHSRADRTTGKTGLTTAERESSCGYEKTARGGAGDLKKAAALPPAAPSSKARASRRASSVNRRAAGRT
jgi:hypothetical protein